MDIDGLIILLMSVSLILLCLGVIIYIFTAVYLSKICKANNEPIWMAWVPIANTYVTLKLSGGIPWISFYPLVGYLLSNFLPILSLIFNLGCSIYVLIYVYKLLIRYNASKVCFWIGILFFPCMLACYYQAGKNAELEILSEENSNTF